ncbi:MAG: MBOAT family O-acyltransferase, partial [Candidatus Hodarchaeota archaeon]
MLFNSYTFLIFIIIVLCCYYSLSRKLQNRLLLLASYIFYGWWDWRFLSLLAISSIVNFFCGKKIASSKNSKIRKMFLIVSLCTNLGILGFFKYCNFFSQNIHNVLRLVGLQVDFPLLEILLPVGISFYTFQAMAYTIDIYRRHENPCNNFWDFALYVSFFPQLVAGPIERSVHLLPQFQSQRKITPEIFYSGCQLILMGYFKKILIADTAAPLVNEIFGNINSAGTFELIIGVYLFALQIYGDFAGYSDIARGVSRLFGINLCLNFKQPYLTANITEFWRCWHISLSSWLRDYLYISLGGNRHGTLKTYRNIMLTMLLGGLWHGASWNFVIWGGLHGLYLSFHKLMLKGKKIKYTTKPEKGYHFIKWMLKVFLTFNLVSLTWIFFRAKSLSLAIDFIYNIFNLTTY